MTLWAIKGGSYGEREDRFLQHSVIGIGWDDLRDLSTFPNRDDLKDEYRKIYQGSSEGKVNNHVGQLWAFARSIRDGDLVVVPLKTRSQVAVGRFVGEYRFVQDFGPDMRHVRNVNWLATDIPRTRFDQDLLYSFGAFMTVCTVHRNNAEARVTSVLTGKPPASDGQPAVDSDVREEQVQARDIEQEARDRIIALIESRFKGHPLAQIVDSILRAQGYTTRISPPGPDGGVDIVAARGSMGFDEPRVVVQVKSGNSTCGTDVLQTLKGTMQDYGTNHGLLVAWGGFKDTPRRDARNAFFGIRLWDQRDLLSNFFLHYEQLDGAIRALIPLKRIWVLAESEELAG